VPSQSKVQVDSRALPYFSVDVDDEVVPAISASAEFTVIDLEDGGISH
jgi:hypothetical protein